MHGIGLGDEWPLITYPNPYDEGAFEGVSSRRPGPPIMRPSGLRRSIWQCVVQDC